MGHRDIVVIGGSAGSLQVLQTILPALPWDFPAAVFVVLHTSEDSPGLLPEILNRGSKLPVMYAVHGADILPARVYIAPAGQRHMLLDRGRVRLEPGPRENRSRPSIDALFRSASYAYGNQVIGVVLSGNLDDGSASVLPIKNRGGMAIAQDPDEALAPSMPASAIEAIALDFVLPAEQIGPKLVALAPIESTEEVRTISTGEGNMSGNMSATGQTYACPECGGVLEEAKEGGMLRFRCRVGHMYPPKACLPTRPRRSRRHSGLQFAAWKNRPNSRIGWPTPRSRRSARGWPIVLQRRPSRAEKTLPFFVIFCRRPRTKC